MQKLDYISELRDALCSAAGVLLGSQELMDSTSPSDTVIFTSLLRSICSLLLDHFFPLLQSILALLKTDLPAALDSNFTPAFNFLYKRL